MLIARYASLEEFCGVDHLCSRFLIHVAISNHEMEVTVSEAKLKLSRFEEFFILVPSSLLATSDSSIIHHVVTRSSTRR